MGVMVYLSEQDPTHPSTHDTTRHDMLLFSSEQCTMHRPKPFRLPLSILEGLRLRKKTQDRKEDRECNKRWSDVYQAHTLACEQAINNSSDKILEPPPPPVEEYPISLYVGFAESDDASFYTIHTETPTSPRSCCRLFLHKNDMPDREVLRCPVEICYVCDLEDIKENMKYAGIRNTALYQWL